MTSIAATGTELSPGDVVYSANGVPTVALQGEVPAWRSLSTSSDDGVDVLQLEQSLVELGYDPTGAITVDETYTGATAAAVSAWQDGLGVEPTGEVELGTVVFLPDAAEVTEHHVAVGSSVSESEPVVTVATASRQIVAQLPDEVQATVEPGLEVELETSSGRVAGIVSYLRAVTGDSVTGSAAITVEAVISPSQPLPGEVPGAEVVVLVTLPGDAGVLTVPTEAVASRIDGSYAVQLIGPSGEPAWVAVTVGATVGQRTAVTGPGLEAGAKVLEPA